MSQIKLKDKVQRLEHALKVLVKMTPHERKNHFDMGVWAEKNDCGTIACLAGHCGLDPWFRKRGFKLDFQKYGEGEGAYFESEFSQAEPDEFFGDDVNEDIFCRNGTYVQVKRRVEKAIKDLKEYGSIRGGE